MIEDTPNTAPEEAVADAGAPEEAVANAASASLTLNDLANLKQIIEVVARRGAFQASEMTVVGATYNNVVGFLQSVMPPQSEATEEEETEKTASEA